MNCAKVTPPRPDDGRKTTATGPLSLGCVLLVFSLVSFSASPLPAGASNESATIDLSEYEGNWERIEDAEADQARLSAIGRALEGLTWIMRKFASPILRKTTKPPAEMSFVWDGEHLHQGVRGTEGEFSRPIELGAEPYVGVDNRGVEVSSAWAWDESGLRVHWDEHQATGSNLYRIDARDRTLIVEHTIKVTGISNVRPIVFLSRFSRTDSAESEGDESDSPPGARAE